MRISSIERDEVARLIRVHTEEGEDLEVALNADEARGLAPGLLLEQTQADALRQAAERKAIARKVFAALDKRRRTRSWLQRRMQEHDHEPGAIESVLDDFERQGLVDDADYARAWCRDQLRRKPVGRRWLLSRLRQEGVEEQDAWTGIDAVLTPEREEMAARTALAKKSLGLGDVKQRAKAMRFLQSRGFGASLCRKAIDQARHEQGEGGGGAALEFDDI